MKKIQQMMSCACVLAMVLGCGVSALEVAELTSPLTRSYADKHFSKDYNYRILEDNTVRRTWQAEGKSIIIDFDIRTEKAVSIFIAYESAVDKSTAMADAKVLTEGRREGCKWITAKKAALDKVGLKKSRLMRLTDKSLLFWERAGKEKCARLCWFASAPKVDRLTLGGMTEYSGRTALGNIRSSGTASQLLADEERRMRIEPVPVRTAAAVAEPVRRPRPVQPAVSAAEPSPSVSPAAPVAVVVPAATAEDVPDFADEEAESHNLLQAMGLQVDDNVMKWVTIGGGVLLLLIFWGAISSARRRAKQRAAFEKLLKAGEKSED